MTNDRICTYEVCKLAKEKGFRERCIEHYYDDTKDLYRSSIPQCYNFGGNTSDAPTQSLLQRWLREEKGIQICIDSDLDFDDETFVYEWQITNKENFNNGGFEIHRYNSEESHCTYELALEDALKYALKNLV